MGDSGHRQYAGKLAPNQAARLIRQGRGRAGRNIDDLETTVDHLDELGIPDKSLLRLARAVRRDAG